MASADDIEHQAAAWLNRRDADDWSAQDQAALEAWLEASPAHKAAYWRLESGWAKVGRLAALRETSPARRTRGWDAGGRGWQALAATLAALAVMCAPFSKPGQETVRYQTPVGVLKTVPLADGSKLELSSNTVVRASVSATGRAVWLDRGEAYFEVKHDPAHPFVVHVGDRKVTVLGTKFAVRFDADQTRVVVLQGRVRFAPEANDAAPTAEITRNELAVARGRSMLVTAVPADRATGLLSWRTGMLSFDKASLQQAAAEFNRYNDTQLVVGDSAAEMRIGGAFEARNIEAFVRLLQSAYGLKLRRENNQIIVSG